MCRNTRVTPSSVSLPSLFRRRAESWGLLPKSVTDALVPHLFPNVTSIILYCASCNLCLFLPLVYLRLVFIFCLTNTDSKFKNFPLDRPLKTSLYWLDSKLWEHSHILMPLGPHIKYVRSACSCLWDSKTLPEKSKMRTWIHWDKMCWK